MAGALVHAYILPIPLPFSEWVAKVQNIKDVIALHIRLLCTYYRLGNCLSSGFSWCPAIDIIKTDNIVFAQVTAALYFYQFKGNFSGIG